MPQFWCCDFIQVEGIQWLKGLGWKARTKPLEALLLSYRARHEACVKIDNGLPGNYIRVTSNSDLGTGNTLPSVITGEHIHGVHHVST